jgi:hypothetical protein
MDAKINDVNYATCVLVCFCFPTNLCREGIDTCFHRTIPRHISMVKSMIFSLEIFNKNKEWKNETRLGGE